MKKLTSVECGVLCLSIPFCTPAHREPVDYLSAAESAVCWEAREFSRRPSLVAINFPQEPDSAR